MPISLCFEESGVTVTEIYFCSVCASAERWRVAMYKLLCFWCPLVVYLGGVCGRCDARFCTHTSGRRTTTDCGSLSDRRRSFAEAEWRHARATKRLTSVFKREREREMKRETACAAQLSQNTIGSSVVCDHCACTCAKPCALLLIRRRSLFVIMSHVSLLH